ncbi:MAG: hypothetical protein PVH88_25235 [Ignavibacteria bacterium]
MGEIILNIYLVINNGLVVSFKAKAYEKTGSDEEKIKYLKGCAAEDFQNAYVFDAPVNRMGNYMSYNKFNKLEMQGMHYQLFEGIFSKFDIPDNPLICVTPVVDGKILANTNIK